MISIYISISTLFLAVMVSFLVITVWNNYAAASLNSQKEAQTIFVLYQNIYSLPNTSEIQLLISEYLEYVIKVEYPQLKNGDVQLFGAQILGKLQTAIYDYSPADGRESTIYNNCVGLLNAIVDLRVSRIHNNGLSYVIWLVAIFDSVLIVIMTWFLHCKEVIHYLFSWIYFCFYCSKFVFNFCFILSFQGTNRIDSSTFPRGIGCC